MQRNVFWCDIQKTWMINKVPKTTWTRSDVDINMCSLCKHWNTAKYDQFNKCCRQLLETTAQQTHSYRLRAHIEITTKIRKEERRECFKMLNKRKTRKRWGPLNRITKFCLGLLSLGPRPLHVMGKTLYIWWTITLYIQWTKTLSNSIHISFVSWAKAINIRWATALSSDDLGATYFITDHRSFIRWSPS